jgi:hypothetical protein
MVMRTMCGTSCKIAFLKTNLVAVFMLGRFPRRSGKLGSDCSTNRVYDLLKMPWQMLTRVPG